VTVRSTVNLQLFRDSEADPKCHFKMANDWLREYVGRAARRGHLTPSSGSRIRCGGPLNPVAFSSQLIPYVRQKQARSADFGCLTPRGFLTSTDDDTKAIFLSPNLGGTFEAV
jgi:hypothetical protein